MEITVDPLGRTNAFVYDAFGNIIAQTNALGQATVSAYDNFNNKTNQITFHNNQAYTNSYVCDTNGSLLSSTDPLGYTNGFTYNGFGEPLSSSDARGDTTYNSYDANGELTNTVDALNNTNQNTYNDGLLTSSTDPVSTVAANFYDTNGNMIASAVLGSSGVILSSNSYSYDANNNRITSTIWRHSGGGWAAATTTNVYDAQNRVTQTINPDGGTNTVVYNVLGQQQETIDALGNQTSYSYDALGRLIQTVYSDGTTNVSSYDAAGNRTNSVDQLGRPTTYIYDALNRLVETVYADGTTNGTVYDDLGRVAQTVDARGTINANTYDADGRRIAVTNAVGSSNQNISSYAYDPDGNQITFTDANNHTTTNVFDALNRQWQVQYPDGTTTETVYDGAGRSVVQTNQDGIPTFLGYDGAGRLVAVTNALHQATQYQYDEAGNQTAQIDALNRTNSFLYDGQGRRIMHQMPGGQSEGFAYDLDGNQVYHTNFNGVVITNRYDALNRLTNRASINGYQVSFAYTATGQRLNMTDASGATSYGYDNRDRLISRTNVWSGGPTVALCYGYDANGNVTNLWSNSANGVTDTYQYDPLNRLTNVLANGSPVAGYSFDLVGNLQTVGYGNGVTNLYQYDSLNRLTNLTWKLNASSLANFSYLLGATGNRTNLTESVNGTNRIYAWQYDSLYRLTNENFSASSNLTYGYDPVGNRIGRTNGATLVGSLTNQAFAYGANDWLLRDQYDSDGNTTNSPLGFSQYNAMDQLVTNGSISIVYDGDGNRVAKTKSGITTFYLVDDRNSSSYAQVLEEWTVTSSVTNLSRVYNYGLSLVSQRIPGISTNYFGYDGHGSTRFLTGLSGTITDTYMYDAFGNLINQTGSNTPNNYLYCGQQFDPDLGLYYNRARYLGTDLGRFWTSDQTDGNNEDPLSLHKYLYGADNPIDGTDPSGNDELTLPSVTAAAGIGAGVDAFGAGAVVGGEATAEGTVLGTEATEAVEATEASETAVAGQEAVASEEVAGVSDAAAENAAKTTLRQLGKTCRSIIEQTKKLLNKAQNDPIKIVPMPRSVIQATANHIVSAMAAGQPFELERVDPTQIIKNREAATGLLGLAGLGKCWDEYPFASGKPPRMTKPADVAKVPLWESCVQGGIIIGCYKVEKIKVGDPFTVVVIP